MTFANDGDVGIGTETPVEKLDVVGDINATVDVPLLSVPLSIECEGNVGNCIVFSLGQFCMHQITECWGKGRFAMLRMEELIKERMRDGKSKAEMIRLSEKNVTLKVRDIIFRDYVNKNWIRYINISVYGGLQGCVLVTLKVRGWIDIPDLPRCPSSNLGQGVPAFSFLDYGNCIVFASGVKRVRDALREFGLVDIIINEVQSGFNIEVFSQRDDSSESFEKLTGGLTGGLNELLEFIENNSGVKVKEISEKLERPIDTLDKQIKKLVDKNLIERRGSKKTGGYWRIK